MIDTDPEFTRIVVADEPTRRVLQFVAVDLLWRQMDAPSLENDLFFAGDTAIGRASATAPPLLETMAAVDEFGARLELLSTVWNELEDVELGKPFEFPVSPREVAKSLAGAKERIEDGGFWDAPPNQREILVTNRDAAVALLAQFDRVAA